MAARGATGSSRDLLPVETKGSPLGVRGECDVPEYRRRSGAVREVTDTSRSMVVPTGVSVIPAGARQVINEGSMLAADPERHRDPCSHWGTCIILLHIPRTHRCAQEPQAPPFQTSMATRHICDYQDRSFCYSKSPQESQKNSPTTETHEETYTRSQEKKSIIKNLTC